MATIQKVQNRNGSTHYRAIIRKAGLKPITKTFSTKRFAIQYTQRIEGDLELAQSLGNPTTSELTLHQAVVEYLGQYQKKDRRMTSGRLWWWVQRYGHLSINIDAATVKAGLRALSDGGCSGPTLNRYKSALSGLFIYLMEEYDPPSNPLSENQSQARTSRSRSLSVHPGTKGITHGLPVFEMGQIVSDGVDGVDHRREAWGAITSGLERYRSQVETSIAP